MEEMVQFGDEYCKWYNNLSRHKGEFGLEIETEGLDPYTIPKFSFWKTDKDNSLRGPFPIEYVLKAPLKFEQIDDALQEFEIKLAGAKAQFDTESFTTSTHVHINMLNENLLTMANFLAVYILTENLLKKYAGPTRESNLFCLPICDAERNFNHILELIRNVQKRSFSNIAYTPDTCKYAALNLSSINKFGSFEVRLLRGTTNRKLIKEWVSILNCILVYARQKGVTPKTIIEEWRKRGAELLTDIFGEHRTALKFKDEDALIDKNLWYVSALAYTVNDWIAYATIQMDKKLTPAEFDKVAMELFQMPFNELTEERKQHIVFKFKYHKKNPNGIQKAQAFANGDAFGMPIPQPQIAPQWAIQVEEDHDDDFEDFNDDHGDEEPNF